MYEQNLVKIVEPVKINTIKRLNKKNKWEYGYNKENDIVVISKTGKIGEIIEMQGLRIALPMRPVRVYSNEVKKWQQFEYPKELSRLKNIFDWRAYPEEKKAQWYDYIDEEFKRREEGFWFDNKGTPTYITGTHYMYLQWSKIDVGAPDFREANRLFYIFWEACKADKRCYGMCYLKNRRSGFSFMSSAETVNQATLASDSRLVYYLKQVQMLKKCLQTKLYQYQSTTRSFLNRFKTVWTGLSLSLLIEFLQVSSRVKKLLLMRSRKTWLDLILLLIGKIQVITVMMEKSYNY